MRIRTLIAWAAAVYLLLPAPPAGTGERAEDTYTNPVLVETFLSPAVGIMGIGDPTVIFYKGKYYLYPTGDNHGYDVYVSSDLIHWKKGPRVFRSDEGSVWAPDVFHNPADGKFYLSYTANKRVGVAVADWPDGDFTDRGILVDNAIDANMFLDDDGRYYLYYVEFPAFRIWVQPMETPFQKNGKPVRLIEPTEPWEKSQQAITEAPWMLKHDGTYYLLYSGGGSYTDDYAIGYATSKSPLGPFVKHHGNPIMKKGNGVYGPGHCATIRTPDGRLWMVYHQKKDTSRGWDRIICIDPIWFDYKGVLHGKASRSVSQFAPVTR